MGSFRNERGLGVQDPHKARGTSHKGPHKNKALIAITVPEEKIFLRIFFFGWGVTNIFREPPKCHLSFRTLPLGNSDHYQIHVDIKVKPKSKYNNKYRINFLKGKCKDMRKNLAKLDWNNMLRNKTAIKCRNIKKCDIEQFVSLKKQGKRSRKKHLLKEAIRKLAYTQNMWMVYRCTLLGDI